MAELFEALRFLPADQISGDDLKAFTLLLSAVALPHRLSEDNGQLVLWVDQSENIAVCQDLFKRFQAGELNEVSEKVQAAVESIPRKKIHWFGVLRCPVTLIVSALCLVGFLLVKMQLWPYISVLSFQGLDIESGALLVNDKNQAWQLLKQGEIWRLFTPIFLHFSFMHIAFNVVLFVFFAKQIEEKEGSIILLSHVLMMALLSNLGQFWFSTGQLFGGLSGVVYGLMAYCWLLNILRKRAFYAVPQGLMLVSVIMIGLSLIGVFSLFGMSIANWAHILGLLAGLLLAAMRK